MALWAMLGNYSGAQADSDSRAYFSIRPPAKAPGRRLPAAVKANIRSPSGGSQPTSPNMSFAGRISFPAHAQPNPATADVAYAPPPSSSRFAGRTRPVVGLRLDICDSGPSGP